MTDQPKPNVAFSLLLIHKVVTRGLQVSIEYVHKYEKDGFPDETTQVGFLDYIRTLVSVLNAHHLTEDELAFPDFKEKLPDLPVDLLVKQHREMLVILDELRGVIGLCADQGTDLTCLQGLASALVKLNGFWLPHIAIEEEHFNIQRIGEMLPVEEHLRLIQAYVKHNQENTGNPSLSVPFILFNLPADLRAVIAKGMPKEVTEHLVPDVWKDQWAPMKPFLLV